MPHSGQPWHGFPWLQCLHVLLWTLWVHMQRHKYWSGFLWEWLYITNTPLMSNIY